MIAKGITNCNECGKPLNDNEFGLYENCKNKKLEIIVPTFYDGCNEPKEPKEGDIWQNLEANDSLNQLKVYLEGRWHYVVSYKNTGYTNQKETKSDKYKEFFKLFKQLSEEIENEEY